MTIATVSAGPKKLKIGFVLTRSFTLSAFALFVDTLRLASDEADRSRRVLADWQVLASSRNLITSSCGVQVAPNSNFGDPHQFDYIVVVGGLLSDEPVVDRDTFAFLQRAAAGKIPLIGLCTGTFVLAEAGLLKDHHVCVSWLHYHTFRERFPDHRVDAERLFNLDKQRGSCAGGSSAADMAASIVRQQISKEAEKNALEVLQIEKARSSSEIQPRRPLPVACGDPRLRAALILMEHHIEDGIPIAELASSVGLSRRQLERLFKEKANCSPAVAYKRIRMERARHLLVQTRAPLFDIAIQVGIENASQFSRVFRQVHGRSPRTLREGASPAP